MYCMESNPTAVSYGQIGNYLSDQLFSQQANLSQQLYSFVNQNNNWRYPKNSTENYNVRSILLNGVKETMDSSHPQPIGTTDNATKLPNDAVNYNISVAKPKHPHFAVKSIRITSFRNYPCNTHQTPIQMADAGFFYSGKQDVVCCFFCGQGLGSWDPEDKPWIEHAKWSPECRYVIDVKGAEFVEKVKEAQSDVDLMNELVRNLQLCDGNQNNEGRNVTDSCRAYSLSSKMSTDSLLETIAARSLIENGTDRESVRKAINIYVKRTDSTEFKGGDLMKIIFELEDGILKYEELPTNQGEDLSNNMDVYSSSHNDSSEDIEVDGEYIDIDCLKDENTKLKERTICKHCTKETVSVVFLPCGHLCCCYKCAPDISNCPICNKYIKATVKTYLT